MKVLIVVGEINKAGVANAALNFYRACNKYYKDLITFDVVSTVEPIAPLKSEFLNNATRYFVMERIKSQGFRNYIRNIRALIRSNGPYCAVHSHLGGFNWLVCKAAKQEGILNRIAHAHGSAGPNKVYDFCVSKILSVLNRKYSTMRFACSNKSGKYTFKKDFEFLPNIIGLDKVKFDITRNLRDELGIDEKTKIIGYLGLFEGQKNAAYIVDIMKRYKTKKVLCLAAGDGPFLNEVRQRSEREGTNSICFLGYRNDANDLLRIFDVLVMPSLSEGMSMSLLSAQLIGTPCVVSNGVPNTNDLGFGLFTKVSDFNVNKWCDAINAAFTVDKRKDFNDINERFEKLKVIGYDEETIAKRLIEAYLH